MQNCKALQTSVTRPVVPEAANGRLVRNSSVHTQHGEHLLCYIQKSMTGKRTAVQSAHSIYRLITQAARSKTTKQSLSRVLESHLDVAESSHYSLMTPQGRKP